VTDLVDDEEEEEEEEEEKIGRKKGSRNSANPLVGGVAGESRSKRKGGVWA